jgi:hypothetical protein
MIDAWLRIAFAVNNVNRSMGLSDVYPFFLSEAVIAKLGFIHDLVHAERGPVDGRAEAGRAHVGA